MTKLGAHWVWVNLCSDMKNSELTSKGRRTVESVENCKNRKRVANNPPAKYRVY